MFEYYSHRILCFIFPKLHKSKQNPSFRDDFVGKLHGFPSPPRRSCRALCKAASRVASGWIIYHDLLIQNTDFMGFKDVHLGHFPAIKRIEGFFTWKSSNEMGDCPANHVWLPEGSQIKMVNGFNRFKRKPVIPKMGEGELVFWTF